MVKTRILTALLLLLIWIPILSLADPSWVRYTTLVVFALAGWEWARISKLSPMGSVLYGAVVFVGGLILSIPFVQSITALPDLSLLPGFNVPDTMKYLSGINFFIVFAAILWVFVIPLHLLSVSQYSAKHPMPPKPMTGFQSILGLILLWGAWLAFIELHGIGFWVLLSVMSLVWFGDVFALFAGKSLGRIKLAPHVSPNKTLEGALGALIGGALCVMMWYSWNGLPNNYFFFVGKTQSSLQVYWLGLCLIVFAIMGDLYESALKRMGQIKDSSQLLPGHGGILDRIDALLPVLPLAYLAYYLPLLFY